MTSKLEEVARAINAALKNKDGEQVEGAHRAALFALLAIRGPTKEMVEVGYKAAAFPRDPEICVAMFNAMIDAALEGK